MLDLIDIRYTGLLNEMQLEQHFVWYH